MRACLRKKFFNISLLTGRMFPLHIIVFVSLALLSICEGYLIRKDYKGHGKTCFNDEGYMGECAFFDECYEEDNATSLEVELIIHQDCPHFDMPSVCCLYDKVVRSGPPITLLPSLPNCGKTIFDDKIDDRIIGGNEARPGAWPWTVALGTKYRNNWVAWICGGTLIAPNWVLTAAHCYYEALSALNWAKLGSTELSKKNQNTVELSVTLYLLHEHYIHGKLFNDIGLMKLSEKVKYSSYIRPICLPIAEDMRNDEYLDEYPFIAGWGSTQYGSPNSKVLMELQMPVVNRNVCNSIYQTKENKIIDTQICAGSLKGGKDACQGDSGGGLVLYNSKHNAYYAIGLVSYGYKCAIPGYPGVYTRVGKFIDWIAETMSDNN